MVFLLFPFVLLFLLVPLKAEALAYEEVVYSRVFGGLKGYLCKPEGAGPFLAVVYHHGGKGNKIGGAPRETCEALAQAGFVGFSPLRRPTVPMEGHPHDVSEGLDYVKGLPFVDARRIGIMGFSRGASLTLLAAAHRPEVKAQVLMAPAPAGEVLEAALSKAVQINAPTLLLVAENDHTPADHLRLARQVKEVLETHGKEVRLIVYPPYGSDGHHMFFEVGKYWGDVLVFLRRNLDPQAK